MEYRDFFRLLTGHEPFSYQQRLAREAWPDLLDIPTGLGKTAAVAIAWLYRRLNEDAGTPRRLVYCLPMRVLVEQTLENVAIWLDRAGPLFADVGADLPQAFVLMGGESDREWVERPELPALVIGTQDMLLSRALMRGYGMSRYQWPIHFALLHTDALWVFDEIQLMGAGLATTAQLEAFRRSFSTALPCRSLWVSATLNRDWLATIDFRDATADLHRLSLGEEEMNIGVIARRRTAVKRLARAETMLTRDNRKQKARQYARELAAEILSRHVAGTTTLVILNSVERAQALFAVLEHSGSEAERLLVHSRFRPVERRQLNRSLGTVPAVDGPGRIIVATQAVEAGVDMTSRVLFTELAPWSSLVQRFGRCNRYGEAEQAAVFWIDIEQAPGLASPYEAGCLDGSRVRLASLAGAGPAELPPTDEPAPVRPVLRRRDLLDLFNTEPDLSGFDVDVSPYVRDSDQADLQLFWRSLDGEPQTEVRPGRDELCRASMAGAGTLLKRLAKKDGHAWRWDSLDEAWRPFRGDHRLRPGLVLLLDSGAGGYDVHYGFRPDSRVRVPPGVEAEADGPPEGYGRDWRCQVAHPVTLERHLDNTLARARRLCRRLAMEGEDRDAVCKASGQHDVGKALPLFQATMYGCDMDEAASRRPFLARSGTGGRHGRRFFRHELASMLAWLEQTEPGPWTDLVAYLILAHHGKVRMSLRAMPGEQEPAPGFGPRFARGIWEGEQLPAVDLPDGGKSPALRIRFDLMELGRGAMGPSWSERAWRLVDRYGPFRLAWLETLVRLADWRASAEEGAGRLTRPPDDQVEGKRSHHWG